MYLLASGVKLTSIVSVETHPVVVSVTFKKYNPLPFELANVIVSSDEIKFSITPELLTTHNHNEKDPLFVMFIVAERLMDSSQTS